MAGGIFQNGLHFSLNTFLKSLLIPEKKEFALKVYPEKEQIQDCFGPSEKALSSLFKYFYSRFLLL